MGFSDRKACFSVLIIFFSYCFELGTSTNTITLSQIIKDNETVSSNGSLFTLGFFTPPNSTNRYVGIWYMTKSTVVWVANRNQPLMDSSGVVTISKDSNLVVLNGQKQIIWSSNVSNIAGNYNTTTCQLLDSGNLVLQDNSTRTTIWQSFEHPSDTYLPNMKISSNQRTGERMKYKSWKSPSDPSIGNFYLSLERLNVPQLFIWNGTHPYCRSGPWNGQVFTGVPSKHASSRGTAYNSGANMVFEEDGTVYYFKTMSNGSKLEASLNSEGKLLENLWDEAKKEWQLVHTFPTSSCDVYGICGAFGSCNLVTSPICKCLRGFEPRNREEWNRQNWISGCVRSTALRCEKVRNETVNEKEDGFFKLQNVKAPDYAEWSSVSEYNCRSQCLGNCSCSAYSFDNQIGCMSWSGNLTDIQQFQEGQGMIGLNLFIRVAYSELEIQGHSTVIIIISAVIGTIISVTCAYFLWKWIAKNSEMTHWQRKTRESIMDELSKAKLQELLAYDFEKVAKATHNFHMSNKLGQGGFGPVYKGKLQDGQDIAVKRLSRVSGQGLEEFMNEVIVISKLQHRNLVRLLGCCIEQEEKMLIYEYMPNKSLDAYIFDPLEHQRLDWHKRFSIIEGVARGVLYLHRDSRLKIIHRDLKASNILLDENMIPKISDFGMARIFGQSEDQANTRRIVGTYGYMSPEYAMEGLFSEKSDVFSFGVLLIEIASGRKNSSFFNEEHSFSLLGFAWKLWNEGNIVALIDPKIVDPRLEKDIVRCIHIGLLCVQEIGRERPNMSTVISMLSSEIQNLPHPKQPAFIQWQSMLSSISCNENEVVSNNVVSITSLQGR